MSKLDELAKLASVSKSTVSRVINKVLEGNDLTIAVQLEHMLEAEDQPTAHFVTSPSLLEKVIGILNKRSLRIPEDISIVTFDETYVVLPRKLTVRRSTRSLT